jgi:hypothetical protein
MREIRIPSPFNRYDTDWFYQYIKTYNSEFYIDIKRLDNLIDRINSEINIKSILYVIYQILINNDLSPSSLNPKPSNGIELRNPTNLNPLGIYHIHLDDKYVLLWYLEWNDNGYSIKFLYEKHPPTNDNYRTIIESIYNGNNDGYNFELEDYFKNLKKILIFDILEVMKFHKFLLHLKNI